MVKKPVTLGSHHFSMKREAVAFLKAMLRKYYVGDALFNYKRGPEKPIASGATLDQDEAFLASDKDVKEAKVVLLRPE
jgi:hypothetical protein